MQKLIDSKLAEAKVISLKNKFSIATQDDSLVNKLIIPLSEGHRFIEHDDIIRLESLSNYTKIYTRRTKIYLVSKTMKSILEKLPKTMFLRVHNSHAINVNAIELLANDFIQMSDNSSVPISRSNRKMVFERLNCT